MGIKENIISLFFGRCDIYETEDITDDRGVTGAEPVLKYNDIECRLVFGGRENYGNHKNAGNDAHKNNSLLNVRVFMAPDIYVKPGSILRVRQNGISYRLRSTAEGCIYRNHQEIMALPDYSEV